MKKELQDRANTFLKAGLYIDAAECFEQEIEKYPESIENYLYLGLYYVLMERDEEAQVFWATVLLDENFDMIQDVAKQLVQILEENICQLLEIGEIILAVKLFNLIFDLLPDYENPNLSFLNNPDIWQHRILELLSKNQYQQTIKESLGLLSVQQDLAMVRNYLASAYYCTQQYSLAQAAILKAIEINSDVALFHFNYALIAIELHDKNSAIKSFKNTIAIQPDIIDAYLGLAGIYVELRDVENTIKVYESAYQIDPSSIKVAISFYDAYTKLGMVDEAKNLLNERLQAFPEQIIWKYLSCLKIPAFYMDEQEIIDSRLNFEAGLKRISESLDDDLNDKYLHQEHLNAICLNHNFYLAYQGYNDLSLQVTYGKIVEKIINAHFSASETSFESVPRKKDAKIRVGFISGNFFNHSGTQWLLGWLEYLDTQKFETYCYYFNSIFDLTTQKFINACYSFKSLDRDLNAIYATILRDQLDILIYSDIGMDSLSVALAARRLAPIQCNSWGHPVTSGLSTIDYYLSSELMEPLNGDEHYSEKLVRLPNLGINYPLPVLPNISKNKTDYGLGEGRIAYVACQTLFKYLPQYDEIYPRIAQEVQNAQFMFVEMKNNNLSDLFKQRLSKSFSAYKLSVDEHCVFLPKLGTGDYLQRNMLSDIYLDTIGFSGGNTALHAVACNLPIVTYAGEFMRGRLAYGVLKGMDITETIATTVEEYISIAIRLGIDKEWRLSIENKIKERSHTLFNDKECVKALEVFLLNAANLGTK